MRVHPISAGNGVARRQRTICGPVRITAHHVVVDPSPGLAHHHRDQLVPACLRSRAIVDHGDLDRTGALHRQRNTQPGNALSGNRKIRRPHQHIGFLTRAGGDVGP